MCFDRRRGSRRAAFSLVEIMVVLVIIGLLAGVVTVNVRSYMVRAKQNTARQEIATITNAIDSFFAATGEYPTNEQGIEILTQGTDKLPEPLLKHMPVDPWGRPYQYNAPGRNGPYEVICYGQDGREGGEGVDADISSDNLKE